MQQQIGTGQSRRLKARCTESMEILFCLRISIDKGVLGSVMRENELEEGVNDQKDREKERESLSTCSLNTPSSVVTICEHSKE